MRAAPSNGLTIVAPSVNSEPFLKNLLLSIVNIVFCPKVKNYAENSIFSMLFMHRRSK